MSLLSIYSEPRRTTSLVSFDLQQTTIFFQQVEEGVVLLSVGGVTTTWLRLLLLLLLLLFSIEGSVEGRRWMESGPVHHLMR